MSGFYPDGGVESRQVLVYLHGHGGTPERLDAVFRGPRADGRTRVCPRAPLAVEGGWSWFHSGPRGVDAATLDASIDRLRTVVGAVLDERGSRWSDVVLGGFSQGGATALAAAAAWGAEGVELGGLLLHAAFVPETFDRDLDLGAVRCRAALVQHGDADDVVPPFLADEIAAGLDSSVGRVTRQLLAGGHVLTAEMLDRTVDWLGTLDGTPEPD